MARLSFLASFLFLIPALVAQTGVTQKDYTGTGRIYVLKSDNWRTATPNSTVGCLDDHGRFVSSENKQDCGLFTRLDVYPHTLSTKVGNCSFEDDKMERNTDSIYGSLDYAWSCNPTYVGTIYDGLYTIDGFPYVFLCFGDIACFYDAKTTPKSKDKLPLWQYRWGSQQMGITPGHVMLQLLWEKASDLSKKEDAEVPPGPRVEVHEDMQIALQGKQTRSFAA